MRLSCPTAFVKTNELHVFLQICKCWFAAFTMWTDPDVQQFAGCSSAVNQCRENCKFMQLIYTLSLRCPTDGFAFDSRRFGIGVWLQLCEPARIGAYLRVSCICAYPGVSARAWAYLRISGRICAGLGVSARICACLSVSACIRAYLRALGAYLRVSGCICAYLTHLSFELATRFIIL